MAVGVGEIDTEAQGGDVLELVVAVRDVAPRSVPGRQHVRVVRVVVGRRHGDPSDTRGRIEVEVNLPVFIGFLKLKKIFFELTNGAAPLRPANT